MSLWFFFEDLFTLKKGKFSNESYYFVVQLLILAFDCLDEKSMLDSEGFIGNELFRPPKGKSR